MRTPIIAGNWKMNLGRVDDALAFVRRIRHQLNQIQGVDIVFCPPFTVLPTLAEVLRPTRIGLGAQSMHWEEKGAYTGEVSPSMLKGVCQYVIIGHSERRTGDVVVPQGSVNQANLVFEGDAAVNKKVHAAIATGITPIICVGENLEQKRTGQTHTFVSGQVQAALAGLSADDAAKCVLAYEPIWAIGSGQAATPAEANRIIGLTRNVVKDLYDTETAEAMRIQYGGSVKPGNIKELLATSDIDGALVGGASLDPESFLELVNAGVKK